MKTMKPALRGQDVRKGNEKLVLRLIQEKKDLSQSEVVELTGLKAPTILRIFSNLEEQGLIQITEAVRENADKKGRKPVFYTINAKAAFLVGVEFWSSSVTVVISNFIRQPVFSLTQDLPDNIDGTGVLTVLKNLIQSSLKKAGVAPEKVIGVGIGAPGRVDTKAGTVLYYSRIPGLVNFPLKPYLEEQLGLPVLVHNNCSVIAMNEYSLNSEELKGPIMAILIRGGVGGAYINNGKILTAGPITTMEIGHLSVDPKGLPCSCGRRGCLETYLSEGAILEDLSGIALLKSLDELEDVYQNSKDPSIKKEIGRIIREKGDVLAYAVQNLNNLFSPRTYLIISRSRKFSTDLAERLNEKLGVNPSEGCTVAARFVPVEYNPLHAGMGACDIIFNEYFRQE